MTGMCRGMSGTGQDTLGEVWDRSEDLRDGSGDPRGCPGRVGGP